MIQQVTVDGSDIQALIFDKLAPACVGEKPTHSIFALITYTIILMKPHIEVDELRQLVMDVSEYLVLRMAPAPEGAVN